MKQSYWHGLIAILFAGIVFGVWYLPNTEDKEGGGYLSGPGFGPSRARAQVRADARPVVAPAFPRMDKGKSVRLALGSLGMGEEGDQRVRDLVLAMLTKASGLEMVERESLAAALSELHLNLSGVGRAKDAMVVGKLARADWFLLGTPVILNGTNSIVARIVDTRTGVLLDASVFSCSEISKTAEELTAFTGRCRTNMMAGKTPVYMAIGGFRDNGVNNRLAEFPEQMRGYMTAAYKDNEDGITLLEREAVAVLLREINLDLAGLTEGSETNAPVAILSAYWLVEGSYQSYESSGFEVELAINVNRMFGRIRHVNLREAPGENLMRDIKRAIDESLAHDTNTLVWSRLSETRVQISSGKEISGLQDAREITLVDYSGLPTQQAVLSRRNLEEGIRAFQTALLLDPSNREAKVFLAGCLQQSLIARMGEARNYFRSVLEEDVTDAWTPVAEKALVDSFRWEGKDARRRYFESALRTTSNPRAARFYRSQTGDPEKGSDISWIAGAGGPVEALVDSLRKNSTTNTGAVDAMAKLDEFALSCKDRKQAGLELARLLPRLKAEFPQYAPELTASILCHQQDTNNPVLEEFKNILEHSAGGTASLAVSNGADFQTRRAEKDAGATQSGTPSFTSGARGFWKVAEDSAWAWCYTNTLFDLAADIMEKRRVVVEDEDVLPFGRSHQLRLALACVGAGRWKRALETSETFSNRPVEIRIGDTRKLIFPGRLAAMCREKLGMSTATYPPQFDMDTNSVAMHTQSACVCDQEGVWIASGNEVIRTGFDLRTNWTAHLPCYPMDEVTSMCVGATNIWVSTRKGGLLECNKGAGQSRTYRESQGLLMDHVAFVCLDRDVLWIRYEKGFGKLDLESRKFTSFVPSLSGMLDPNAPPNLEVDWIQSEGEGDTWALASTGLERYSRSAKAWQTCAQPGISHLITFAVKGNRVIAGMYFDQVEVVTQRIRKPDQTRYRPEKSTQIVTWNELTDLKERLATNGSGRCVAATTVLAPKGALGIQSSPDQPWETLVDPVAIPNPPTAVALNGEDLWLGGMGYLACFDLNKRQLRKISYVDARYVESIQIAGGYVWAIYAQGLHRVPLERVQN